MSEEIATFEFEGKRYREAPDPGGSSCQGCAFEIGSCSAQQRAGLAAFGIGGCYGRKVIYLLASPQPAAVEKAAEGWRPMSEVPARAGRILLSLGNIGVHHFMWDGKDRSTHVSVDDEVSTDFKFSSGWRMFAVAAVGWRYADQPLTGPGHTEPPLPKPPLGTPRFSERVLAIMESDREGITAAASHQAVTDFFAPKVEVKAAKPSAGLMTTASHDPRYRWGA